MENYIKYLLIMVFTSVLSLTATAQSITPLGTTPAGNTVKKGNLSVSYRIGMIGNAVVSKNITENQDIAEYKETKVINVTAYPNPFCNELKVTFPKPKNESVSPAIQLIDATGKIINTDYYLSNSSDNNDEVTINATSLKQGCYIIRILIGKIHYSVKAIKI